MRNSCICKVSVKKGSPHKSLDFLNTPIETPWASLRVNWNFGSYILGCDILLQPQNVVSPVSEFYGSDVWCLFLKYGIFLSFFPTAKEGYKRGQASTATVLRLTYFVVFLSFSFMSVSSNYLV